MQHDDTSSTSGSPEPLDFTTSSQFAQHEELPSKGYSRLFKAQRYGKWYVLKGLKPEHWADPLYVARLEKEFASAVTLDHPNIVHTHALENDPVAGRCIVMEYIDGRTLSQFLEENPSKATRKRVMMQLLDAMEYYHAKQITHRDLKPSNIMITANGDNVKLIDFGLADTDDYAVLKGPAYTKAYAAPEQLQGGAADCRTDIYAFGVLLREIFPHRYSFVARRCTRYKPDNRYRSASAVRTAIKRYDSVCRLSLIVTAALIVAAIALILLPSRQKELATESPAIPADTTQTVQTTQTASDTMATPITPPTPATPITPTTQTAPSTTAPPSLATAKPILQHYADSLYTIWQARIDNGTYDTYAKAILSRNHIQNLILERLYHLLPTMHEQNDAEWHQCWYALNESCKIFMDKTNKCLNDRNLPKPDDQYASPEAKALTDSVNVSAKRLGNLVEAEERNRWKRYN